MTVNGNNHTCLSVCLSGLCVFVSVCLSVCLCVCLSQFLPNPPLIMGAIGAEIELPSVENPEL